MSRYSTVAVSLVPQADFNSIANFIEDVAERRILVIWQGLWPGEVKAWRDSTIKADQFDWRAQLKGRKQPTPQAPSTMEGVASSSPTPSRRGHFCEGCQMYHDDSESDSDSGSQQAGRIVPPQDDDDGEPDSDFADDFEDSSVDEPQPSDTTAAVAHPTQAKKARLTQLAFLETFRKQI